MRAAFDSAAIRAILLDIEGTTTPVSFVYDVLFPYAREGIRDFLRQHCEHADVVHDVSMLRKERSVETAEAPPEWQEGSRESEIESAARYALWLMDRDRKSTALKSLQGKIWESGYRSGQLRGDVYPDVAPALARWRAQGRRMAIFSSGSVLAQRLLFAHSSSGDLTPYFEAYFDTTIGSKREEAAYRRISETLSIEPPGILFLSDVVEELEAARRGGYVTMLCMRPGVHLPKAPTASSHPVVATFDTVLP